MYQYLTIPIPENDIDNVKKNLDLSGDWNDISVESEDIYDSFRTVLENINDENEYYYCLIQKRLRIIKRNNESNKLIFEAIENKEEKSNECKIRKSIQGYNILYDNHILIRQKRSLIDEAQKLVFC